MCSWGRAVRHQGDVLELIEMLGPDGVEFGSKVGHVVGLDDDSELSLKGLVEDLDEGKLGQESTSTISTRG